MKLKFKISRYNPENNEKHFIQTYEIECKPYDSILNIFKKIKEIDGTFSYRRSCGHAVCGSCAVSINGESKLACKTIIKTIKGKTIEIKPLKGFAVIKDLVIDTNPFFEKYKTIKPYFINDTAPPEKERLQKPKDQKEITAVSKCIACASCTSSCPSFWKNKSYLGPSALLKSWRFITDTRDTQTQDRINQINNEDGIWRCHLILNCFNTCPKDIDIPIALSKLKRAIK